VHNCILFLSLIEVRVSFWRNGGNTKSETSHFSDTNYICRNIDWFCSWWRI